MFYPTNSFVVLEDIENFNQNLKSIPLEMVKYFFLNFDRILNNPGEKKFKQYH
jgi:hypothetical protein